MMNIYDDADFFEAYARMGRSQGGLAAAGEWHQLRRWFPNLEGKAMLDLGCGYGWHCAYAAQMGAKRVLGLDQSEKMLEEARMRNAHPAISYVLGDLRHLEASGETFDFVLSNLALHYVEDLDSVFVQICRVLRPGGVFLLNIEHPVFTAGVNQDWVYDEAGKALHWPVDDYFYPGKRMTCFLGRQVEKYHHTLTQIFMGLVGAGFQVTAMEEAMPEAALRELPEMKDEMRRPMMLMVQAKKC